MLPVLLPELVACAVVMCAVVMHAVCAVAMHACRIIPRRGAGLFGFLD